MGKWTDKELVIAKDMASQGRSHKSIAEILERTPNSVRNKLNKLSVYINKPVVERTCKCCGIVLTGRHQRKFCSRSCAAKVNNTIHTKRTPSEKPKTTVKKVPARNCKVCGRLYRNDNSLFCSEECISKNTPKPIHNVDCINCGDTVQTKNPNRKFCSNECCANHKNKKRFRQIESGNINLPTRAYKKYLIYKHSEKCMECGWCEVNKTSNTIPIELEHIDGDSSNNKLDNLKLLCPNCHSLTPTYKALNKGKGRHKRMERYHSGKSF